MEEMSSPTSLCGCDNLFPLLYILEILCIKHLLLSQLDRNAIICSQKQKRHKTGGDDLFPIPQWQELEVLNISATWVYFMHTETISVFIKWDQSFTKCSGSGEGLVSLLKAGDRLWDQIMLFFFFSSFPIPCKRPTEYS